MNKKGFTIVELVIVIAVIAILAAILIPTFANVVDKANVAKVQAELKNAKTQYIMEASDDKNYNPDLELVYKHVNNKGKVVYYLEEEGVFVPASGSQFDEDNLLKSGFYFVPLQYKGGTDEWLFAEFGEGTVGVLAYEGALVESYGGFIDFKSGANTLVAKATDLGFELTGDATVTPSTPSTFSISFSIERPEGVAFINPTVTADLGLFTQIGNTFNYIDDISIGTERIRVTIDWDGSGTLFSAKIYEIDLSILNFS